MEKICEEHEKAKKDKYLSRVLEVEKASFVPLIFLTNGIMGKECMKFNNRLASLISEKKGEKYNDVVKVIRTKLRFSILKSTLIALRGFRRSRSRQVKECPMSDISFNLIPGGNRSP